MGVLTRACSCAVAVLSSDREKILLGRQVRRAPLYNSTTSRTDVPPPPRAAAHLARALLLVPRGLHRGGRVARGGRPARSVRRGWDRRGRGGVPLIAAVRGHFSALVSSSLTALEAETDGAETCPMQVALPGVAHVWVLGHRQRREHDPHGPRQRARGCAVSLFPLPFFFLSSFFLPASPTELQSPLTPLCPSSPHTPQTPASSPASKSSP